MFCSNCEKPSNLTLCKQCQKEFQDIEDQESLDRLADQDFAELEYEQGYDEEYEAYLRMGERDEMYDARFDHWYSENSC